MFRILLVAALLLLPAVARAQVTAEPRAAVFPDPNKFARGLYTEGEVGGVTFFGKMAENVSPGFGIGARVGYDLTRWFAVQLHALGSTHGTKDDGPADGQLLQVYRGVAEAKATLRFRQLSLFAEGGVGVARLSTNLLYALGLAKFRTGLTAGGGLGIDYHSLSRHFSLGLRSGAFWLRDVSSSVDLISTVYLRYTF